MAPDLRMSDPEKPLPFLCLQGTVSRMEASLSERRWKQAPPQRVLQVAQWIGRGGSATSDFVDRDNPTGVSPAAVRRLAYACLAEMTTPPATAGADDLEHLEHPDGLARMRCPIWTEAGRSRLAMDYVLRWPGPEPGDGLDDYFDAAAVYIEQVVDTETGLVGAHRA